MGTFSRIETEVSQINSTQWKWDGIRHPSSTLAGCLDGGLSQARVIWCARQDLNL